MEPPSLLPPSPPMDCYDPSATPTWATLLPPWGERIGGGRVLDWTHLSTPWPPSQPFWMWDAWDAWDAAAGNNAIWGGREGGWGEGGEM